MRSALAARMYAAVQLSSQQQQMYVNKKNLYEKKMQLIIYQRFIIRKKNLHFALPPSRKRVRERPLRE